MQNSAYEKYVSKCLKQSFCNLVLRANNPAVLDVYHVFRNNVTYKMQFFEWLLGEIKSVLVNNDLSQFKSLVKAMDLFYNETSKETLISFFFASHIWEGTNPIVLACQFNSLEILEWLLININILLVFYFDSGAITPFYVDEQGHNAIYYAIRSNNVKLVDTLISKWITNYHKHLDLLLSSAYEELTLKNVQLTDEMQYLIHCQLVNLRFFSQLKIDDLSINQIVERIKGLLENIDILCKEFENNIVDEKFLYIAKLVAKDIHILKKHLKITNNQLPWEEIEFLLVIFLGSHLDLEMNKMYESVLSKAGILKNLKEFSESLGYFIYFIETSTIEILNKSASSDRSQALKAIIEKNPQFRDMCKEFRLVKDLYSLDRMVSYISYALLVNSNTVEGQLTIKRALRVIEEQLKNTLESPNLSGIARSKLPPSALADITKIHKVVRDSLSHPQNRTRAQILRNIQKDLKTFGIVVVEILDSFKKSIDRKKLVSKNISLNDKDGLHDTLILVNGGDLDIRKKVEIIKSIGEMGHLVTNKTKVTIKKRKKHRVKKCSNPTKMISEPSQKKRKNRLIQKPHIVIENDFAMQKKITVLKHILEENDITTLLRSGSKRAAIEMLVLEILSDLDTLEKLPTNNMFYLDGTVPLLTGKNLHIYLAHGSNLVDLLSTDIFFAVLSNAKYLTDNVFTGTMVMQESAEQESAKLDTFEGGLCPKTNPKKFMKMKMNADLDQSLRIIEIQNELFVAIERGDLEEVKKCIKKGADVKSRNFNFQTTLHVAAKGTNINVINFLIDEQVNASHVDLRQQTVLHIAARYGREMNMQIFMKITEIHANSIDVDGNTPLDIASQNGHTKLIQDILSLRSNNGFKKEINAPSLFDTSEEKYSYMDFIINLLEHGKLEEENFIHSGLTLLHLAVKHSYFDLIKYLVDRNVDINAKDLYENRPLHYATKRSIIITLLQNGAHVNHKNLSGLTPLHCAVKGGLEETVISLLDHGAFVNNCDVIHSTPLHDAAAIGHTRIVEILINKNAQLNAVDHFGHTPLMRAAEKGHIEVLKLLLLKGAFADCKTNDLRTILHISAMQGFDHIVSYLLENVPISISSRDKDNRTALHLAVLHRKKDIVKTLLINGADCNDRVVPTETPMLICATEGLKEITEILLQMGADIKSTNGKRAYLHVASSKGHLEIVEILIKAGANVNIKDELNQCPLHLASLHGHVEIVKALIKANADPGTKDMLNQVPLHFACSNNKPEIVEALIRGLADIDTKVETNRTDFQVVSVNGRTNVIKALFNAKPNLNVRNQFNQTPLLLASLNCHVDTVKALLREGAEVNAKDDNNRTSLHTASLNGYIDVVNALIGGGADVNKKDQSNHTPLHLASLNCHVDSVISLLREGAEVNAKDENNRTSLHTASLNGHIDVVEALILGGADVNKKDQSNHTPLHLASLNGFIKTVKYLVRRGAHIDANDEFDKTPLHLASRNGQIEVMKYLLASGASIDATDLKNATPLHEASANDHNIKAVELCIQSNADVNARTHNGDIPLEVAAKGGHIKIFNILLQNMIIDEENNCSPLCYIAKSIFLYLNPLEKDQTKEDALRQTLSKQAELCSMTRPMKSFLKYFWENRSVLGFLSVLGEPSVNYKCVKHNWTFLHYAAYKGQEDIVEALLKKHADPNATGEYGNTPLHCALQSSEYKITKILLVNGSKYNTRNENGMTPVSLTTLPRLVILFARIDECFRKVLNGDSRVIDDLEAEGQEIVEIIMRTRNEDNKTLVIIGIETNFSQIDALENILQDNTFQKSMELTQGQQISTILPSLFTVLEKRKVLLGGDNPGTLKVLLKIGIAFWEQSKNPEALHLFNDIYDKLIKSLGQTSKLALETRFYIAKVLGSQKQYEQVLNICNEIYEPLKAIQGERHNIVLETGFLFSQTLNSLGKEEDALKMICEVCKNSNRITDDSDILTSIQYLSHKADILESLDRFEEALEIQQKVLKSLTRVNKCNLESMLACARYFQRLKNYEMSIKVLQYIFAFQKINKSPSILTTQSQLCEVLNLFPEKQKELFKHARNLFGKRRKISDLSENHASTMWTINNCIGIEKFVLEGDEISFAKYCDEAIINSARKGEIEEVRKCIINGSDVNTTDDNDRTPLFFATGGGHKEIVRLLLNNGSDVDEATDLGETALHVAVRENFCEIVELLLENAKRTKYHSFKTFINLQTLFYSTSALHFAAKKGCLAIARILLRNGACYNLIDANKFTPLQCSIDLGISALLELCKDLFENVKAGNEGYLLMFMLSDLTPEDALAVISCRDSELRTPIEAAIFYGHEIIARDLELIQAERLSAKVVNK